MKFNSQICTTKEQSERLLALGLKKETADMMYLTDERVPEEYRHYDLVTEYYESCLEGMVHIPAWSLHRLMEMMPKHVKIPKPTYGWVGEDLTFRMDDNLHIQYEDWGIENEEYRFCSKGFYNSNLYDNIIACIEWLIIEGHFKKEYLEE